MCMSERKFESVVEAERREDAFAVDGAVTGSAGSG